MKVEEGRNWWVLDPSLDSAWWIGLLPGWSTAESQRRRCR